MTAISSRTGGQILVDQLIVHGVEQLFCVPGESFLAVLDALHDATIAVSVCRQEGGAAMMAEAQGKLTGRPGICFVTRGPGATNATAGVHIAHQDSTPLLLFVGQVARGALGREAFQELDYSAVFGTLAKWVVQIDDAKRLPELVSRAFHVATSGRPGPVVIALPEDMLTEAASVADALPYAVTETYPGATQLAELQDRLIKAQRPVVILGGSRWSDKAVRQFTAFAKAFSLPVFCSFRRQMLFSAKHACYAGDLGLGANPRLLDRIRQSDLVLLVGGRLSEVPSQGYALLGIPTPQQALVHVHADANELGKLCRAHRISRVISHEETGNLWTFARDRRVRAWARQAGIDWVELPQSGVVRCLKGRDGWAGLRDGFMARAIKDLPALTGVAGAEPGAIPTARMLRLADDRCLHRQAGGRARGLAALDSFLTSRGQPYRAGMSSPLTGERACSRLSPHLALGSLSVREVARATAARQTERPGGGWGGSLASFQSRLAWRDHFIQKLESQPDIETRCLHRATEGLRPREPDAQRLAAWAKGETGLPFLDACMRYLAATGWLNFRMRSMVMAVASYQLWLDWRATGPVLARLFTDYEPGIHWPQVQMQSGTTGINTIRIYNPVKQGLDQDPTGVFTRRWVPELAPVPDSFL